MTSTTATSEKEKEKEDVFESLPVIRERLLRLRSEKIFREEEAAFAASAYLESPEFPKKMQVWSNGIRQISDQILCLELLRDFLLKNHPKLFVRLFRKFLK